MKYIALSLLFSFSLPAFSKSSQSCTIKTHAKILLLKKIINKKEVIKDTNCPSLVIATFLKQVNTFNGTLRSHYLKETTGKNVILEPSKIKIIKPIDLIKQTFHEYSSNVIVHNFKASFPKNSIGLSKTEIAQLECVRCKEVGTHDLLLKIVDSVNDSVFQISATATISKSVGAFMLKDSLSPFDKISKNNVIAQQIKTTEPHDIFKDIERLRFFKLKNSKKKGTALKKSDLLSKYLVVPNNLSKIILKSNGLTITKNGTPMRNGKFGEIVTFRVQGTKKLINAKVIDFNKAVSEL